MTCDEFRAWCQTPAEETTRGERASALRHGLECPACDAWVMNSFVATEDLERTRRDMEDPEYRAAAGLPPLPG